MGLRMTRVLLLWAAPTSTNLGVRALGEGSAALVRRVAPSSEIVMQSYGHGPAPANVGVIRTLARDLVLDSHGLRSWIREFDLVVDTRAGDSFTDIYGLRTLRQICAMAEFVRACGVPLVLGPQTIGPFNGSPGRLLGSWSLRRAVRVMARDSVSAGAAAQLGRAVDVLTTDVVFALPQPAPQGHADVLLNVSGLLWSTDDHGPAEQYRAAVRSLIAGLQQRGRVVSLVSHVLASHSPDNDEPAARQLQDEFSVDHVVPASLDDMRAIAAGAQLLIGSRMHACLNALSVGTPAIPLAYSRKFAPLLGDLGWRHVVDLSHSTTPGADLLAIIDAHPHLDREVVGVRSTADALLARAEALLREYV
jgi:polysaccharide pyruvyl transferase WcaK-like protein